MARHNDENAVGIIILIGMALPALGMLTVGGIERYNDAYNKVIGRTCRDLGKVTDVRNCSAGKYSLRCDITTTKTSWNSDVTTWPGSNISIGDQLQKCQEQGTHLRIEQLVRNGMMTENGGCNWLMSCWKEKTK